MPHPTVLDVASRGLPVPRKLTAKQRGPRTGKFTLAVEGDDKDGKGFGAHPVDMEDRHSALSRALTYKHPRKK